MAACGVDFVKVGITAHCVGAATLDALRAVREHAVICVCAAESPPSETDIALLAACGVRGVMLDTFDKLSRRLPELLTADAVADFVGAARGHGLLVGLAGRLRVEDISALGPLGADYLGFRGALCSGGLRTAAVDIDAVRGLGRALRSMRRHRQNTLTSEVA